MAMQVFSHSCRVFVMLAMALPGFHALAQCSDSTTLHAAVHHLTRESSNSVDSLAGTQTIGDYWERWDSYVSSTEKVGSTTLHSSSQQVGYAQIASLEWHDSPSSVGVGTFSTQNSHTARSQCGDSTSYNSSNTLVVNKPTITGASGAWYLGGGSDPNNNYYNAAAVQGNSNCNSGDTCSTTPYWSVIAGGTKVSLSCSVCLNNTITTAAASSAVGDVQLTISISGLTSDPYHFTSNTPKQNAYQGCIDSNYGSGYQTRLSNELLDISGSPMSRIASNETIGAKMNDIGNNWPTLYSGGFPYPSFTTYYPYIWFDYLVADLGSYTPASVHPGAVGSTTKVDHYSQDWRFGSSTVGSGIFIQSDVLTFYRGHATVSIATQACH